MDILCIEGQTPGRIRASVAHQGEIRHVALDVARHPAGGWQARAVASDDGPWGPRCHAVTTAVLLQASEAFAEVAMELAAD